MAERRGHSEDDFSKRASGVLGPNTKVTLAVVISVTVFMFGVGVWVKGQSTKDEEHDKAINELDRTKMDRRDFQAWVRELQRDPQHIPEPR